MTLLKHYYNKGDMYDMKFLEFVAISEILKTMELRNIQYSMNLLEQNVTYPPSEHIPSFFWA